MEWWSVGLSKEIRQISIIEILFNTLYIYIQQRSENSTRVKYKNNSFFQGEYDVSVCKPDIPISHISHKI